MRRAGLYCALGLTLAMSAAAAMMATTGGSGLAGVCGDALKSCPASSQVADFGNRMRPDGNGTWLFIVGEQIGPGP